MTESEKDAGGSPVTHNEKGIDDYLAADRCMMGLQSALFSADRALQACLISDPAHVTTGAVGEHVTKIHSALVVLDYASIDVAELREGLYGRSTAAAVLAFKRKRRIVNYGYQTQADNIVGKMTIAAMDREMLAIEHRWARTVYPTPATG